MEQRALFCAAGFDTGRVFLCGYALTRIKMVEGGRKYDKLL